MIDAMYYNFLRDSDAVSLIGNAFAGTVYRLVIINSTKPSVDKGKIIALFGTCDKNKIVLAHRANVSRHRPLLRVRFLLTRIETVSVRKIRLKFYRHCGSRQRGNSLPSISQR